MSKQQTAVQQLVDIVEMDYRNGVEISMKVFLKMLNDSKEMEKQQIIDAANWDSKSISENGIRKGEQYYNETFKKD
jgi:hypothetical protein